MSADNRQAMHAVYVEETGLAVTLSLVRYQDLRKLDERKFTADDVRSVLRRIKALINRGANGYSDASMDWRNCMAKTDTFEEHLLRIRQARGRAAGAKREAIAQTPRAVSARLPDGSTVNRLASAPNEKAIQRVDVAKALRDWVKDVEKGDRRE